MQMDDWQRHVKSYISLSSTKSNTTPSVICINFVQGELPNQHYYIEYTNNNNTRISVFIKRGFI